MYFLDSMIHSIPNTLTFPQLKTMINFNISNNINFFGIECDYEWQRLLYFKENPNSPKVFGCNGELLWLPNDYLLINEIDWKELYYRNLSKAETKKILQTPISNLLATLVPSVKNIDYGNTAIDVVSLVQKSIEMNKDTQLDDLLHKSMDADTYCDYLADTLGDECTNIKKRLAVLSSLVSPGHRYIMFLVLDYVHSNWDKFWHGGMLSIILEVEYITDNFLLEMLENLKKKHGNIFANYYSFNNGDDLTPRVQRIIFEYLNESTTLNNDLKFIIDYILINVKNVNDNSINAQFNSIESIYHLVAHEDGSSYSTNQKLALMGDKVESLFENMTRCFCPGQGGVFTNEQFDALGSSLEENASSKSIYLRFNAIIEKWNKDLGSLISDDYIEYLIEERRKKR